MLKPQEPRGASRPGEQDQQQNSLDGAAAHAPKEPMRPRTPCARDKNNAARKKSSMTLKLNKLA